MPVGIMGARPSPFAFCSPTALESRIPHIAWGGRACVHMRAGVGGAQISPKHTPNIYIQGKEPGIWYTV